MLFYFKCYVLDIIKFPYRLISCPRFLALECYNFKDVEIDQFKVCCHFLLPVVFYYTVTIWLKLG